MVQLTILSFFSYQFLSDDGSQECEGAVDGSGETDEYE
jgi:hypothetical protein